jgi:N-acetyl-gamma-glutamyl-phosphate reductase
MHMVMSPSAGVSRSVRTAGVAGASGYGGLELQRLLAGHPQLRAASLQARSGGYDPIDVEALARCDVAFLALPHGESRGLGEALEAAGTPVVDLGSDFRVDGWVYGLTELAREQVRAAPAIANPGCYATATILGLVPLVEAGLVDGPIAVDGKSGVSGAGKTPTEKTHLPELHGGVTPYSVTGHRHIAEIEQALGIASGGAEQRVTFTPHLLPTSRGLLVTAYVRLREPLTQEALDDLYATRYAGERFVRVGGTPAPQRLAGSNTCHVASFADPRTSSAIVVSALDNLVKGAAGQAIQNANLMLGLDEAAGLTEHGLWP